MGILKVDDLGRIKTLNKMGWSFVSLDEYSQAFIEFASQISEPVLEIGAGHGMATIAALKRGATVTANDLDARHLQLIKKMTPKEHRKRLELKQSAFPVLEGVPNNFFGAVLCVRVFHFFDGSTLEKSVQKIHSLLRPTGKVFIVTNSPYNKNWSTFIPIYEERKQKGEKYPGIIEDIEFYNPGYTENYPRIMHFLDVDILKRVFEENGFKIEKVEYMNRQDYPIYTQLDGRESIGLIAYKE